ncbi:hypothetical protein WAF17_21120 [Bernardetia sp. ABR2-2B]|uniref:hypothetical protein n=1 Tax=Bernardetia sp. ABR2-2B TaxID=3127472 RepID=UPI0030D3C947
MKKLFEEIEVLIELLLRDAKKIDKELMSEVEKLLKKLESDNENKYTKNSSNREAILEAVKKLEKIAKSKKFESLTSQLLSSFDKIVENNQAIHASLNKIEFTETIINNIAKSKELAVNAVSASLSTSNVNANAIAPIRRILLESIELGFGTQRATKLLRERIVGMESEGAIGRYVNQIARDALYEYDGVVNQTIAIEYDMNAYRYVGGLVKDSRPQCEKWHRKKVLKIENLDKEIKWAYRNGSGMKPNTNENNFIVKRGGWNCRHRAIPIIIE